MNIQTGIDFAVLEGTWLSPVYVARGPCGLVAIGLGGPEEVFLASVEHATEVLPQHAEDALHTTLEQLRKYLLGDQLILDLPIDWSIFSPFQQSVLQATCCIPPGRVVSYSEIARRIRRPGAARCWASPTMQPYPAYHPLSSCAGDRWLTVRLWRSGRHQDQTGPFGSGRRPPAVKPPAPMV